MVRPSDLHAPRTKIVPWSGSAFGSRPGHPASVLVHRKDGRRIATRRAGQQVDLVAEEQEVGVVPDAVGLHRGPGVDACDWQVAGPVAAAVESSAVVETCKENQWMRQSVLFRCCWAFLPDLRIRRTSCTRTGANGRSTPIKLPAQTPLNAHSMSGCVPRAAPAAPCTTTSWRTSRPRCPSSS
jgi:hypothetical protein